MNSTFSFAGVALDRAIPLPTQTHRFWTYLFSDVFSLLSGFPVLYFLLVDRALRQALYNHVIIILLILGIIFELTAIPWLIYNDYNHVPLVQSTLFYQFWTFLTHPITALQTGLFAWATIERHILIFHTSWVSTSKRRFFIHYLPIAAIIIYCLIYYGIVYFATLCNNSYNGLLAGSFFIPCVFDHTFLGVWDLLFHQVVPILMILVFSIALIARSIWQKNRLRRGVDWRKHRKMIIQLLSISAIYIIFNAPWVSVIFAYQYGLSITVAIVSLAYTSFFAYYVIFLFPLVCFLSMSELRKKFRKIFSCQRRTRRIAETMQLGVLRTIGGPTMLVSKVNS